MSDTVRFYFNGMVNKQNRCRWFHTNAREILARPRLNGPRVTYSVPFHFQGLLRFVFREKLSIWLLQIRSDTRHSYYDFF